MKAALDRIEPWTATGVGSLPFTDPVLAASHACVEYELPFCPQLPRLDGDMIAEWLGADPGRCGWSPDRDRERPHAWDAFLRQMEGRHPPNGLVKLQATGPVTLALALEGERGARPARARTLELAGELSTWLAGNLMGQIATLAELGLSTLLVTDEPALARFGTDERTARVWDPLRGIAAAWGLHLCCEVPWSLVDSVEPDLLSFDLHVEPLTRRSSPILDRLIARGGAIAWGAVSTAGPELPSQAVSRLRDALAYVPAARDRCLLTASCGTGLLPPAHEYAIAASLTAVAREMRRERA